MVTTASLNCQIDLRTVASKGKNAVYNPKRFPACVVRFREPKATVLVFATGKMVCTGARDEEDASKASRKMAKIISKMGFSLENFLKFLFRI